MASTPDFRSVLTHTVANSNFVPIWRNGYDGKSWAARCRPSLASELGRKWTSETC